MPNPVHVDVSGVVHLLDDRYVRVIYGLIDPRKPDLIAYIGKTESHLILRYLQHLQDGCRPKPIRPRHHWLGELRSLHMAPGICIIESVGFLPADLGQREMFWIAEYQAAGQAWLNAPLIRSRQLREQRQLPSLSEWRATPGAPPKGEPNKHLQEGVQQ